MHRICTVKLHSLPADGHVRQRNLIARPSAVKMTVPPLSKNPPPRSLRLHVNNLPVRPLYHGMFRMGIRPLPVTVAQQLCHCQEGQLAVADCTASSSTDLLLHCFSIAVQFFNSATKWLNVSCTYTQGLQPWLWLPSDPSLTARVVCL